MVGNVEITGEKDVLPKSQFAVKERGKRRKMVKLRVGRRVVGGGTRHLNKLKF